MTLAEIYNKQNGVEKKQEQPSLKKELVIHMQEVAMLMQDENKQANWFNPGQGIKQSESVN